MREGEPGAEAIAPGWRWRHLVVEQEIGAGAFGVVWLGRDTLIGRPVALKVVRSADPERADALLVEARALGQVQSPNVVVLYGVHRVDPTTLLLEMEHVDGGTLETLLGEDRRLPVSQVVGLARGIAAGLAAVHVRRFVHGDVKPANVLLTRDGVPKLADFGLARLRDQPEAAAPDGIAGTPHFMAPEAARGEAPTAASDIWSLGVILHRALVGAQPFRGEGLGQLFHSLENDEPSPSLGPEVPPALARCVGRCLAKRAGDRYASASEVADELRRIANPAILPRDTSPTEGVYGRDAELERIARAVAAAASGAGDALLLLGAQGSGKTALLRAAAERARRDGFRCVDVVVTPLAGLVGPLLRRVRQGAGAAEADPAARPPPAREDDLFTALGALATAEPLAFFVDGAEHVEPSEARALRDVVRRLLPGPALVVVAARYAEGGAAGEAPQDPTGLSEMERVTRIDLGPLDAGAIHRLVGQRAEGAVVDASVVERVVALCDGNPQCAEEVFQHMLATGAARVEGRAVVAGEGFATAEVPRRMTDLVGHRLARLPGPVRDVLDAAAVAGVEFDGEEVASVLERSVIAVLRPIQRLCRAPAVVAPRTHGYRFSSVLFHEVVYGQVAPELRRELHRRFAEFHEARGAEAESARVGRHWEGAGRPERAVPHLLRAATQASRRQEFRRTIDLARRAGLDPARLDARAALLDPDATLAFGSALSNAGRALDAERVYDALLAAASEREDVTLHARTLVRRGMLRHAFGRFTDADEAQVRRVSEALPPSVELGWARYLLGLVAKLRGDLATAETCLRGAESVFAGLSFHAGRAPTSAQLGEVASRRLRFEEAAAFYEDSARLAQSAGLTVDAATAEVNRCLVAFQAGDVTGHEERLEAAARTLTIEGAKNLAAHAALMLGHVRLANGDLAGARRVVDEALPAVEAAQYAYALAFGRLLEGALDLAQARLGDAARALGEARAVSERAGDSQTRAVACALEAAGHALAGKPERATRAARQAVEVAGAATDFDVRTQVAYVLVEAAVYGLEVGAVGGLDDLLARSDDAAREAIAAPCREALAAARAYAAPTGDPDALASGAAALAGRGPTDRRAALRIAGLLYDAEARRRRGDAVGAGPMLRAALDRARAMGHLTLELASLERLEVLEPARGWGVRRRSRLREVAAGLPGSSG